MKLANFARATTEHAGEIAEELYECDRERLAGLCRAVGRDTMLRHIAENESVLVDYIRRTPAERRRMMARQRLDADNRMLFLVCAAYVVRCAKALLDTMQQAEGEEAKYRSMTGWAAQAALDLHSTWPTLWPFEDEHDPFDEE
jgi:hypothetical protein